MKRVLGAVVVLIIVAALAPVVSQGPTTDAAGLRLWYDRPTTAFEEALPLGNGRLGAMVFGGVSSDRVMLNESTLWTGGPVNPAVGDA